MRPGAVTLACLIALGAIPSCKTADISRGSGAATRPAFEFVETVTGGAHPGDRLPLVVALHGLGDRPENFEGLFSDFPKAARFVVPHSATPYAAGFSWFEFRRGDPDFSGPGISRVADALAIFIADVATRRPTLGKPTVMGFSQGGALSYAIALRHPEVVAFAIPMSGWLPPSLVAEAKPAGALPVVAALHGAADPLISADRAERAVASLRNDGYRADLTEFDGLGHAVSPEARSKLFALLEEACSKATGR